MEGLLNIQILPLITIKNQLGIPIQLKFQNVRFKSKIILKGHYKCFHILNIDSGFHRNNSSAERQIGAI